MGKKVRNREHRQIEDLMFVHPLIGKNRRVMGTTGLPGIESGICGTQSEKSWVKCKSCPLVCQAQTSQVSPAQRLKVYRSTDYFGPASTFA